MPASRDDYAPKTRGADPRRRKEMRLRQHERLRQRLRQAAADGDVLTIARLQQALAERTLEAVARGQAARVQRIDLKTAGAPPRCRTKRRAARAVVVAAGVVPATAVFLPEPRGGWCR